jgi:NADPH-dependent 2,4-dienoyl-CoA reductase/sulfur reductase-like enzyme
VAYAILVHYFFHLKNLETNVEGIFSGGDVANAPVYSANTKASLGHWQLATYHGKIAALQMLGKKTPIKSVPFFWTALFGTSIRFAGMFFLNFFF